MPGTNLNNLDAYNEVATTLGGAGGDLNDIDTVNAIAVLEGAAGGHLNMINALNAIDIDAGGVGGHLNTLDVLNSIVVLKGGVGGHENDLDAINEWVDFVGLPFDLVSGGVVGYSLRRLSSSFVGSLIRVRRFIDNAEQDIGFDVNGDLDIVAMETFCAATDGFVAKFYDQSGNANDMVQTTLSRQPQIVATGVTIVDANGNPLARFDGTADTMQIVSVALDSFISTYVVGKFTTAKPMFIEHGPNVNTDDGFFFFGTNSSPWAIHRDGSKHSAAGVSNWMGALLAQVTLIYDGDGAYYLNGSLQDNDVITGTARADTETTDALNLLSRNQTSLFSDGDFYEMLIFDGAHGGADQNALEGNQKTKYSTP